MALGSAATRPPRPATRPAVGPRYGHACSAWAHLGAQAGQGCALGAPNQFLGSMHCFSNCLDTIHEHCSQQNFSIFFFFEK